VTREVYRSRAFGGADRPYHLFDDCRYFKQASGEPRSTPLNVLWNDAKCCKYCIRRDFLRYEGCHKCDYYHEVDPDTLADLDSPIEAPCDEQHGSTTLIPPGRFGEKLDSAGVDIDEVRRVAGALVADGGQRERLAKSLEFHEDYVRPIQDGEKTATVRWDDAEDLRPGDRVEAIAPDGERFAVIGVKLVAFVHAWWALNLIEALDAEYPSETKGDLLRGVNRHYDHRIGHKSIVRVIIFYVERDPA